MATSNGQSAVNIVWNALYQAHHQPTLRWLTKKARRVWPWMDAANLEDRAADALQDAWTVLLLKGEIAQDKMPGILMVCAKRMLVNRLRHEITIHRYEELPHEEARASLSSGKLRDEFARASDALTERQLEAWALVKWQRKPAKLILDELGLSREQRVYSLLNRAKAALEANK